MIRLSSVRLARASCCGVAAYAVLALQGCVPARASYAAVPVDHTGKVVEFQGKPNGVQVSASELTELSSPDLGAITVAFSNPTEEFAKVSSISVDFGGPLNSLVSIPIGEELVSWGDAIVARRGTWYFRPLTFVGTIFSSVESLRHRLQTISPESAPAPEEIQPAKTADLTQVANLVPSGHLLAGPFLVPPQMYVRKWILVKSDARVNSCITQMFITYQQGSDAPQKLMVKFRDRGSTRSEWQEKQCVPWPPNELGK